METALFPPKSKLLHGPLLPEVAKWLEAYPLSFFVNSDTHSREFVRTQLKEVEPKIRNWLKPFLDVTPFSFALPTHGVSQAIESWLVGERRPIFMLEGDYQWPQLLSSKVSTIANIQDIPEGAVFYVSNPSAIDGQWLKIWENLADQPFKIILDCAYLGTATPKTLKIHDNVEKVFFSFSKGFGLQFLRLGWSFSKSLDPGEAALLDVSYLSLLNIMLSESLIERFPLTFCYDSLKEKQDKICQLYKLHPADVVLIGQSKEPELLGFQRSPSHLARIPLTPYF